MPRPTKKKAQTQPLILRPDAAGIDIGATELFVAVPPDRAEQSIRSFGAFTEDLHALADWLKACRVRHVAMESTGVYWIPLFQVLEARGFEVCLVNARHVKAVPGRKTDVADCQWLQYLHSVGLLHASFRPADQVCVLRSYLRHRDMLVRTASRHIQHMQKALNQMNLHLHHVISDLTGVTGLAIIDAILAGERDPRRLAALRDHRIKSSAATIAKALVGDYRKEHLFALRQARQLYQAYQTQIQECDREIEAHLATIESRTQEPPPAARARKPERNQPRFDVRGHLHRILGVDLTALPGISAVTAHTLYSEIGADLGRFRTEKHFTSWLGLCPDNRVSGGKPLETRTRKVASRAAYALRMAAYAAGRSHSAIGDFFRRKRAHLGAPKAITATAHKLARIIYHLLTTRQPYDETRFAHHQQQDRTRRETRLRRQAQALGFMLVPCQDTSATT